MLLLLMLLMVELLEGLMPFGVMSGQHLMRKVEHYLLLLLQVLV
jgi:uncharacterized protein (DUF3820 family)